jgi:hypothetical protein
LDDVVARETFGDADKSATKTILDLKTACYNDFVAGLDIRADAAGPLRVLKAIDSASGDPSDSALTSGTKTVTTP